MQPAEIEQCKSIIPEYGLMADGKNQITDGQHKIFTIQ
jgi:hypothetical protein